MKVNSSIVCFPFLVGGGGLNAYTLRFHSRTRQKSCTQLPYVYLIIADCFSFFSQTFDYNLIVRRMRDVLSGIAIKLLT